MKKIDLFKTILKATLSVILICSAAKAQLQSSGPTDNGMRAAFDSLPVSGLDTVNLYNGHVSLKLALTKIGARGGVSYQPEVAISRTFVLRNYQTWSYPGNPVRLSNPQFKLISEQYNDSYDYSNFRPGLLPAVLIGRKSRDNNPDPSFTVPSSSHACYALTKLYLRVPGGQIELRDAATSGQPDYDQSTPNSPLNRGKQWYAADGSATLFVSDTDIQDETCVDTGIAAMNGINVFFPTGYLMERDGTRWRFVDGYPVWMRDRNGNTLTFGSPGGIPTAVDSIGRQYQLNGGVTFKDQTGISQTVGVVSGSLSSALRSDLVTNGVQVKTLSALFAGVNFENPAAVFDPQVIKAVQLPGGLSYRFFYNEYGELSRIEMPTGGAIEYDYLPGPGTNGTSVYPLTSPQIYRVISARRTYDAPGHMQSRQAYSYSFQPYQTSATVVTYDSLNTVVANERHVFSGSVADDFVFAGWYQPFSNGQERYAEALNGSGVVLRRVDNTWATLDMSGNPTQPAPSGQTHPTIMDCALIAVKTTLSDTNQVSQTSFTYDPKANRTDTYEYDFDNGGPGTLIRHTHVDFNTDASYVQYPGPYLPSLPTRKWISSDATGSNKLALTEFEYDNYTTDTRHAPLSPRPNIYGLCLTYNDAASNCVQASDASYQTRGNLTQTKVYSDIGNNAAQYTSAQYDVAGNVIKTIDGRGKASTVDFTDCFGAADGSARCSGSPYNYNVAPAELAGKSAFIYPTATTNTLGHMSYAQFNYYCGFVVETEDINGVVNSIYHNDPLNRLTQIIRARGRGEQSQTSTAYDDASHVVTITSDQTTYGDNYLKSQSLYDGFGRTIETRNYESASDYSLVQFQYDAMGRPYKSSNPFRPNETPVWTVSEFDLLGRPLRVTSPDQAFNTNLYVGNKVTLTDPAGKVSSGISDAAGRLIEAYEDPGSSTLNYQTRYSYDALDNLTQVIQGTQTRTFSYDSLNRLMSATSPESGRICYGTVVNEQCMRNGYDANGNLEYRTDARGVETHYVYDDLNRLISVVYSHDPAATPIVTRSYDGATNGKGRLWSVQTSGTTGALTTTDAYNALGNPRTLRQQFKISSGWSPSFIVGRTYDLAGQVKSETYPSGHITTYNYDLNGRLGDKATPQVTSDLAFSGNLGDGVTRVYASISGSNAYDAASRLQEEKYGTLTPLYHKEHFNIRGQLNDIRLSTVGWATDEWNWNRGGIVNFYAAADISCPTNQCRFDSGADNNGNLLHSDYYVPANDYPNSYHFVRQDYSYDSLNRLHSVHETPGTQGGWESASFTQTYAYDRWGNRTVDTSGNPSQTWGYQINDVQAWADPNTNRLYAPNDPSHTLIDYDAAGNQIKDNLTSNGTRVYDAESRIISATVSGITTSYTYDADGRRVRRSLSNGEVWQIHGFEGQLLAQYASGAAVFLPQKEYGYRNGELLVTAANGDEARLTNFIYNFYFRFGVGFTSNDIQTRVNALAAAGNNGGSSQLFTEAQNQAAAIASQSNIASDTDYVTAIYMTYCQRYPDSGGLAYWVSQIPYIGRTGVRNAFAGAGGEFSARVNNLWGFAANDSERTDAFVQYMYSAILHRWANSSEDTAAISTFDNAGAKGQANVVTTAGTWARGLFNSSEYTNSGRNQHDFVYDLYQAFLRYAPDQAGWDWWTSQVGSSWQNKQEVMNAFINAGPYAQQAGTLYREVLWLTTDHLGTPRMIAERTGSLEGIKRHDYLPFGEELFTQGGRTPEQGYTSTPDVRQKFTSKERDSEIGLDYFGARAYSNTFGRMTSPDKPFIDQVTDEPQSWNLYSYVVNNPTRYVDPFGLWKTLPGGYIEWENENDTWESLAKLIASNAAALQAFYSGTTLGSGVILDIGNYYDCRGLDMRSRIEWTTEDQQLFDRRRIDAFIDDASENWEHDYGWLPMYGGLQRVPAAGIRARGYRGADLEEGVEGPAEVGRRGLLRQALLRNGESGAGRQAHHIVAYAARIAARGRAVLARFGIDINAVENGVMMDEAAHGALHSTKYYGAVNELLIQATTKEEALEVLKFIKSGLENGTFP